MALTGLDIFKLLPKTNCGECGVPTCMAFAMKIAARQAQIDLCPYVSDEVKEQLSEAAAAPVKKITIGVGDDALTIGEETVLFRHEKTFVHPPGLGVFISDDLTNTEIEAKVAQALASSFERVEQQLKVRVIAVKGGANADRFAEVVSLINSKASLPLLLIANNKAVLQKGLEVVKDKKPLIYLSSGSVPDIAALAKQYNLPVVIEGSSLEELSQRSEEAANAGLKEIVLTPVTGSPKETLKALVYARRAAIKKKFKPLGYPVLTLPVNETDNPQLQTTLACLYVAKYGGLIILADADPASVLPILVLSQNIYTDPQKPMQMSQGIYPIGEPKEDSPVLITTNFSLTYFIVSGEIESSKVPAWLCVMDVEGLSVLTAWAAGKFVPEKIAQFINKSDIASKVKHRRLAIPGYVAQISGELQEELGGWKVIVGPREAGDLPPFLKSWSPN